MILSDVEIRNWIKVCGVISGIDDSQINPASVNVRLGNTFLVPNSVSKWISLGDEVDYKRYEVKEENERFIILPGQFVLATTIEEVNLPNNIAAFVQGRSSIGRIGLTTQNAGFVDPGFHGHITLELVNENPNPIALRPGYPIAQLVFFEATPAENPYNGKYNGQVEATGSRMYLDDVKEDRNG